MNTKTSRELINEVGEWAEKNFGHKKHPVLGMVEEIGELSHCLLKRIQGIRGFDNPEHFRAEFTDALADTGIYLMHHCFCNGATFQFQCNDIIFNPDTYAVDHDEVISHILQELARMLRDGNAQRVQMLAVLLTVLGNMEKVSFEDAVRATWEKVQKRNWVANPVDAPSHA